MLEVIGRYVAATAIVFFIGILFFGWILLMKNYTEETLIGTVLVIVVGLINGIAQDLK